MNSSVSKFVRVLLALLLATVAGSTVSEVSRAAPRPDETTGTLPRTEWRRNVPWLTAHQTVEMTWGEVQMVVGSTHDAEQDLAQGPPPSEPQVLESNWTYRGVSMKVKTPRWSNEMTPAGEERWQQRHAEALHRAMQKWPPDPHGFLIVPNRWTEDPIERAFLAQFELGRKLLRDLAA